MAEEKSLREVSQEEADEDPLVFLGCGHVFLMSSLDGHLALAAVETESASGEGLEMVGAYTRDPSSGAWTSVHPLQVLLVLLVLLKSP